VEEMLAENLETEKNFGVSYCGPAHPFAQRVLNMGLNTTTVTWAKHFFYGTYKMEKEAVRMMGALLGAPEAVGFITSGGTESNLQAMRIARNLGAKRHPEVIMPATGHFSFDLAGELFGIKVRRVGWHEDGSPKMDEVEQAITENTVALICSTPGGALQRMDPVEEFAEIAEENDLFLHVDAAFGGFALPFMREMGYDIPPFDFQLPAVSSMTADGHKVGMLPLTCSFCLLRDESYLEGIPVERAHIWTLTSTKNGGLAAAAWALFQHLGIEGYKEHIANVIEVTKLIGERIAEIDGLHLLAEPWLSVLGFASRTYDIQAIYNELIGNGWGCSFGKDQLTQEDYIRLSIHPSRTKVYAAGFIKAVEEAISVARKKT
jgi:tyrosine decarboxylase/aspartate 1-decarboxylase